MATRADHPIDLVTQTNWDDVAASGKPTTENKSMVALLTTGDGDLASNTAMVKTPVFGGYVIPIIRGLAVSIGNGTKDKCCYLSGDGGATARAFADVAAGDKLYWNGSVAGYQLLAGWRIDLYYLESYSGAVGGGGADVSSIITTGAIELWVRPVDGDDSNSGTSSSSPLETIQAALDKIPMIVIHKIVIHIGMHTGGGHASWILGPRQLGDNIWIMFDGGGEVGEDGFTELVGSTAAIAGTDTSKIVTAGGFAIDQYRGKTIEVLTGAATGDRKTIRNHGASEFFSCADFSTGIASGDTFRIVEPTAAYFLPPSRDGRAQEFRAQVIGCGWASTNYYANQYRGKVFVVNARPKADPDLGFGGLSMVDSNVVFLGLEMDPTAAVIGVAGNTTMMCGEEDSAYERWVPSAVNDDVGATQRSSWYGWGMYGPSTASRTYALLGTWPAPDAAVVSGHIVAPGLSQFYADFDMRGGNLYGFNSNQEPTIWSGYSNASINSAGANKVLIYGGHASQSAILVSARGRLYLGKVTVTGLGGGVRVIGGDSTFSITVGADYASITVPGWGVRLIRLAKCEVGVPDGDASLVDGTLGDFSMDDGSTEITGATIVDEYHNFDAGEGTGLWVP